MTQKEIHDTKFPKQLDKLKEHGNEHAYGSVKISVQDHAWLALRDGNISPESLCEVLCLTAALTRLGVNPVELLRQGKEAQDASMVSIEFGKLKKLWNDQIEMDRKRNKSPQRQRTRA